MVRSRNSLQPDCNGEKTSVTAKLLHVFESKETQIVNDEKNIPTKFVAALPRVESSTQKKFNDFSSSSSSSSVIKSDTKENTFSKKKLNIKEMEPQQTLKRGRGRPRKNPSNVQSSTITTNEIDQDSTKSSELSLTSNSMKHFNANHNVYGNQYSVDDIFEDESMNISNNDDHHHNIISVIEIFDESQYNINDTDDHQKSTEHENEDTIHDYHNVVDDDDDDDDDNVNNEIDDDEEEDDVIIGNIENGNSSSILAQNQIDSNSLIIEEIVDIQNCVNTDDDNANSQLFYDNENNYNTESIITISSEENSNLMKIDQKSRDNTPISECSSGMIGNNIISNNYIGIGCGNNSNGIEQIPSPDILHVRINPNSAKTYQNKRKTKTDQTNNNSNNLVDNKLLGKNTSGLNNSHIINSSNIQEQHNDDNINIECRRSSRKKVMKYDVRDLLNKNRKKIQIEARIDSLPKKLTDKPASIENKNFVENKLISPLKIIPKIKDYSDMRVINSFINKEKLTPQKNIIQIQDKNNYENGIQLPPPPPLKSIASLDKKFNTTNGNYEQNDTNARNDYNVSTFKFHKAFATNAINKDDDNDDNTMSYTNESTSNNVNNNSISLTKLSSYSQQNESKNVAIETLESKSIIPTTTTTTSSFTQQSSQLLIQSSPAISSILPPGLSSMVKSPLLNIKFKHQNLAMRKSLDSYKNSSSYLLNNLSVVESAINLQENLVNSQQTIQHDSSTPNIVSELTTDQLNKSETNLQESIETPIKCEKVKSKRGRPAKKKLTTITTPITSKQVIENDLIQIDEKPKDNLSTIKTELKMGKQNTNNNSNVESNTNAITNTNLSCYTNFTNIFNGLENFKMLNTTVKIKRDKSLNTNCNDNIIKITDEKIQENKPNEVTEKIVESNENIDKKCENTATVENTNEISEKTIDDLNKNEDVKKVVGVEKHTNKDKEISSSHKHSKKRVSLEKSSSKMKPKINEKIMKHKEEKIKSTSSSKKKSSKETHINNSQIIVTPSTANTKPDSESSMSNHDTKLNKVTSKKKLFLEEISNLEVSKFKPYKKSKKKSSLDDSKKKLNSYTNKQIDGDVSVSNSLNDSKEIKEEKSMEIKEEIKNINVAENSEIRTQNKLNSLKDDIEVASVTHEKISCTQSSEISKEKQSQEELDQLAPIKNNVKSEVLLDNLTETCDSSETSVNFNEKRALNLTKDASNENIENPNKNIDEIGEQKEIIMSENQVDSNQQISGQLNEFDDCSIPTKLEETKIKPKNALPMTQSDSNDPLKDIEKFLEAADNLLSRSLSTEDDKESLRRRRPQTRFKDANDENELNETEKEQNVVTSRRNSLDENSKKEETDSQTSIKLEAKRITELMMEKDILSKINEKDLTNILAITIPKIKSNDSPSCPPVISGENNGDFENYDSNLSEENLKSFETTVEKRISGPRTPPLPPPSDNSLYDSGMSCDTTKSEISDFSTNSTAPSSSAEFLSSDSQFSTCTSLVSDVKTNKKSDDAAKSSKKNKKKDELKSKKKYGFTEELKRTFKELKKYKISSNSALNKIPNTLSKGALKAYIFDDNSYDRKNQSDIGSFDDSADVSHDNHDSDDQNNSQIRRSHRIKTISKLQNHSVGRGLVRDRERYDKEFDDIKPDLSVIEKQNAKFLKDMEERLSQFQVIRDNEYKCERIVSKEAKKMICDCFLTREEEERGEFGCGEDCLNRLLMIECGPKCTVADRCTNRRFQRAHYAPCKVFLTEKKGCGIMADAEISAGQFIMEYVGEVLNSSQFEKRAEMYSLDKNKHYYFMALRSDAIIDATTRGNISRFINHSCNPNAETQKWTVNGELRIGFFATKTIASGEEITFDYQFQRYGKEAQKCFCESYNCRGWIGEEPDETDEEQDEDSDEEEKSKLNDLHTTTKDKVKTYDAEDVRKSVEEDEEMDKENNAVKVSLKETNKKEKKERKRIKKRHEFLMGKKKHEFLDDPDLEDEVQRLLGSGLKNQLQTLCLSRMIVRSKQFETRLNLLEILRKGEMSCRRLFLDYHGLKLLHGWMIETSEQIVKDSENDLKIRLNLLQTLESLPIPNKTMLKDSKVFQIVQNWSEDKLSTESSPNDSSPNDNSNSGLTTPITNSDGTIPQATVNSTTETDLNATTLTNVSVENPDKIEIKRISTKLISIWDGLPEVFRIPKKERVEQMKEHEREANKEYDALKLVEDDNEIRRNRERFTKIVKDVGPILTTSDISGNVGKYKWSRDNKSEIYKERRKESSQDGLSKLQRRQIFAAKVAQDEAEKRMADEKREFEIRCKFYGLDPMKTHPRNFPFCVNPATGQWYTNDSRKIQTPPSHAHIKVPPKPQSTNPADYQLPPLDLPPHWKFAIDPNKGRIYYYHIKIRIPQWEPPIKILPLNDGISVGPVDCQSTVQKDNSDNRNVKNDDSDSSCSDSDSGEGVTNKDSEDPSNVQLDPEQRKIERRKRRLSLLVQERPISPRREEDRIYNQQEMRRYKENKEKLRRRKEEIKRRKIQLARLQPDQITDTENTDNTESEIKTEQQLSTDSTAIDSEIVGESNEIDTAISNPIPIADYLISSDEEDTIENVCDSKLIDKIVKGEKIVDELDALNINRPLKRFLTIKETIINSEHKCKKNKTEEIIVEKNEDEIKKLKSKNNAKYLARKAKEKFRTDIAGIIVLHLTPYKKDSCKIGRITNNDDFKHLARKLTHFVMVKELKHCDLTGQHLIVTDSVKNKSREFIKKYMAKYGEIYIRPENDPEFKEIPH